LLLEELIFCIKDLKTGSGMGKINWLAMGQNL